MSSRGWGVYNNSTRKSFFDIGNQQKSKFNIINTFDEADFFLMMGKDMVALDAAAAKLFDAKADPLKYVRLAGEAGLGNADLSTVKIKRITLS